MSPRRPADTHEPTVDLTGLVLGRRLANQEDAATKIGWFQAVPAMGLDGLGSAAYGPEAAASVLMPLGAAGSAWIVPVMGPVIVLLAILYLSYRQTVKAYPKEGGAYVVAKENLGVFASLLAATALMIDYILNVAVGISAGVGAFTSAVPALHPYTLGLCLAILALITLVNLRGTGEAGLIFALPTYVFVFSFLAVVAWGTLAAVASGGSPAAVVRPPRPGAAAQAAGVWIIVRAFASGCTAMTGVEAVSNGVSSFKAPVVREARATLTLICLTLGVLLAGISWLARVYGLAAMDETRSGYQSLLSQLVGAVWGRGAAYDLAMSSVLAILCFSANTSFVGFPRLCRAVAQDGFLPRAFAIPGRRLVYSAGILFLAITAAALLIAFDGITDRLIPLFAIGAFLTFTLSQSGMVAHWRRQRRPQHGPLAINALGASVTGVALLVILAAKFAAGAWITVLAIPATILVLRAIKRYFDRLDERLRASGPFAIEETAPPTILMAFERRSRLSDRALRFALTLSPDVIAIHLARLEGPADEENLRTLKRQWEEEVERPLAAQGLRPPRLVTLPAPYRQIHAPLLDFIDKLDARTPGRSVAVLIPELVLAHWWERPLHARRAERLRALLLRHAPERVKVIIAPSST